MGFLSVFSALLGLTGCLGLLTAPESTVTTDIFEIRQGDSSITMGRSENPLLEYRFAGVPYKPYVRQLRTPSGVGVLRDSPADHKHHHALMFAIGAEGVSFWEETPRAGKQVHRAFLEVGASRRDGVHTAGFGEKLEWISPGGKGVLLLEKRHIEICDPEPLGATVLSWSTRLEAAPGKAPVTLGGSHYYGLGARFLVSMDEKGEFITSTRKKGEVVRGDERLVPGSWCAYTSKAGGKPVTVAMFDHPSNPRKALWFTMGKPFAYLSATVNLWKEPLVVKEGKSVGFFYGVALWDGKVEPERIEKLHGKWLELNTIDGGR